MLTESAEQCNQWRHLRPMNIHKSDCSSDTVLVTSVILAISKLVELLFAAIFYVGAWTEMADRPQGPGRTDTGSCHSYRGDNTSKIHVHFPTDVPPFGNFIHIIYSPVIFIEKVSLISITLANK